MAEKPSTAVPFLVSEWTRETGLVHYREIGETETAVCLEGVNEAGEVFRKEILKPKPVAAKP
jgi:hypothetical protein